MFDHITLLLATPIAKVILEKFYEGVGSNLAKQAVERLPQQVQDLGQLIWNRGLGQKPDAESLLQSAADGNEEAQKTLTATVSEVLDQNQELLVQSQTIAATIYQAINNTVQAENVLQNFGGQALQVNSPQEQPIIQVQGNPVFNLGAKPKAD